MKIFYEANCPMKDLMHLNRVCWHKKVSKLSCILMCDGYTIDPFFLSTLEGTFPQKLYYKEPTTSNFKLWGVAIQQMTSPTFQVWQAFGPYLTTAGQCISWFISPDSTTLYHEVSDEQNALYRKNLLMTPVVVFSILITYQQTRDGIIQWFVYIPWLLFHDTETLHQFLNNTSIVGKSIPLNTSPL